MCFAYARPIYQMSVYRTIGPLVYVVTDGPVGMVYMNELETCIIQFRRFLECSEDAKVAITVIWKAQGVPQ